MENFDFLKLGEVPEVDKLLDTDTVLAVRDGEVYRVPKGQVGGAGGYLLQVANDELEEIDNIFYITTPCQEAFDVIRAGGNVTIALDESGTLIYTSLISAIIFEAAEDFDTEVILGDIATFGEFISVILTNGQAVPAETSATALSADNSPLSKLRSKLGGGANAVV